MSLIIEEKRDILCPKILFITHVQFLVRNIFLLYKYFTELHWRRAKTHFLTYSLTYLLTYLLTYSMQQSP